MEDAHIEPSPSCGCPRVLVPGTVTGACGDCSEYRLVADFISDVLVIVVRMNSLYLEPLNFSHEAVFGQDGSLRYAEEALILYHQLRSG